MKICAPRYLARFGLILLCSVALLSGAETRPTAIKYVDGSLSLIGFDSTGKELVKKVEWAQIAKSPVPGVGATAVPGMGGSIIRREVSLDGFSEGSQRSLIKAVNAHGYYATGLLPKNAGLRQSYQIFDQHDNPIGKAETHPENSDEKS